MLTIFSYVSLGFSEIDFATCFLAQVLISPTGDVINQRRKIKPSHVEKLVYGDGAGDTFMSVTDTDVRLFSESFLPKMWLGPSRQACPRSTKSLTTRRTCLETHCLH